jgi:hypothetical protein
MSTDQSDNPSKPDYSISDGRTPDEREKRLLDAARAEGRPQPTDGSRPLSSAHQDNKKEKEGGLKHVLDTGLPPGVSEQDAEDPGAQSRGRKTENNS